MEKETKYLCIPRKENKKRKKTIISHASSMGLTMRKKVPIKQAKSATN
jgi:hypothetical protein